MISVNYQGRLGNNLFQYAVACLLSRKFNQKIENPLATRIILFDNPEKDTRFKKTVEVNCDNFQDIYERDSIDFNIYLNGFFQNRYVTNLFRKNRSLFIETDPENIFFSPFVHIRLGDLLHHESIKNNMPDYDYYSDALNSISEGYHSAYVSSDSPSHPIVKRLQQEHSGINFFNGSPEETLIFASGFLFKILSMGTFSWWIGFLGNSEMDHLYNIIYPDTKLYKQWHGDIFDFNEANR